MTSDPAAAVARGLPETLTMAEPSLFRTILCPVDFSIHSRQALSYAALIAAKKNARLVVVFVEDPLLAAAAAVAYNEKALVERGRKELRRLVERTIKPFRLPLKSVTLDVAIGKPHDVINWTTTNLKCDLIVMGSHGATGANRLMIGSTTHRVLRTSPLPILATPPVKGRAARPPRNWPGKAALAPIDFSPRERADALAAAVVAQELGARLELMHVVEPITDIPWLELDEARRNLQRERRAAALLSRVQDEVRWNVSGAHVATGKPAEAIAAMASKSRIGLVIMTRRRGQGLFGPRQGSISYEVLWRSKTPVMALPSDTNWIRKVVRRAR
jgi:nucleotide-binding universal stress UspA family protein